MNLIQKIIAAFAASGMVLIPVVAQANEITLKGSTKTSVKAEVETETETDVRSTLRNNLANARVHLVKKIEFLKNSSFRSDVLKNLRLDGDLKSTIKAEVKIATTTSSLVAKVGHEINTYRKTVHLAEVVLKKANHDMRATLNASLKAALKAKNNTAAVKAFETYFEQEATAEATFDAARAEARTKFMTALKAMLS